MKRSIAHMMAASLAVAPLAMADWQFRSRPDLAPPRLNITIPATDKVEQGPYIFRDNGDLVWSGYGLYSIWATNFQAGRWKGKDILFSFEGDHNAGYGHGHGHITIVDQHYETIRELRAGNHKLVDKHEFHIVNEETGLIQIYQPVPRDLQKWGASPEQQWIVNAIIQELDIATGKLLFEWSSLDHVQPDEAVLPINPGQAGSGYNSSDAWDYFHINSVDKDAEGNYLISARDACAIHKINGTDGSIIWRLHGKRSDFSVPDDAKFCFQHHARWLSQEGDVEVISLSYGAYEQWQDSPAQHNLVDSRAGCGLLPPDDLLSKSQGSTQVLPGGNVLVNWGSEGALTEFTADGTPIFHAYVDSGFLGVGAENYRAFRYNWTGIPNETPAIVALQGKEGTKVYVSWNGDTETAFWRFYAVTDEYGSRDFLGEVKRTSFETSLVTSKNIASVAAEAVDVHGRVIGSTASVFVEAEVLPTQLDNAKGQKPLGRYNALGADL
ncbi:hypothetical protein MRS44_004761 [Fusarium solani]|uniref:uncharacterized protein n=1 Tax=Fusarium solani TaxID=169388 RepID=UPI0032C47E02|nr:hypothetical protein MRS44_004761 [Fusarium solani]